MKFSIDYSKIRPTDIAVFTGGGVLSLFSRTAMAGISHAADKTIPCHLGIIVEWRGKHFVAESSTGGLQLNSVTKYLHTKQRRWLMDIIRHPVYDDPQKRAKVMDRIAEDLFERKEYDYKGMFRFFFRIFGIPFKEDKDKFYCSEYCYTVTKDDINYPESFKKVVPPNFYGVDGYYSTGAIIS